MQRVFKSIVVVVIAAASGCIEQTGEDPDLDTDLPTETLEQEVNGFVDYNNPEIGLVAVGRTVGSMMCTGTAVSPNVVLTAKHCMPNANFFLTQQAQGATPRVFAVRDRWSSPNTDIGLLWLHQAVPWSRPVKQFRTVGGLAVVYGFGGNSCSVNPSGPGFVPNNGVGVKRAAFFTARADSLINAPLICGGDSGGPVIDWSDGQIFGVTSTSTGTNPGGSGTFTSTNAGTNWADLQFVIFVWQSTSNQGG